MAKVENSQLTNLIAYRIEQGLKRVMDSRVFKTARRTWAKRLDELCRRGCHWEYPAPGTSNGDSSIPI
ncbi:hypothetical protein PAXRUDRAFT_830804, partial [Paxillus rubicundulus Ve08.2h10]